MLAAAVDVRDPIAQDDASRYGSGGLLAIAASRAGDVGIGLARLVDDSSATGEIGQVAAGSGRDEADAVAVGEGEGITDGCTPGTATQEATDAQWDGRSGESNQGSSSEACQRGSVGEGRSSGSRGNALHGTKGANFGREVDSGGGSAGRGGDGEIAGIGHEPDATLFSIRGGKGAGSRVVFIGGSEGDLRIGEDVANDSVVLGSTGHGETHEDMCVVEAHGDLGILQIGGGSLSGGDECIIVNSVASEPYTESLEGLTVNKTVLSGIVERPIAGDHTGDGKDSGGGLGAGGLVRESVVEGRFGVGREEAHYVGAGRDADRVPCHAHAAEAVHISVPQPVTGVMAVKSRVATVAHDDVAAEPLPGHGVDVASESLKTVHHSDEGRELHGDGDVVGVDVVHRVDREVGHGVLAVGASGRESAAAGVNWLEIACGVAGFQYGLRMVDVESGGVIAGHGGVAADVYDETLIVAAAGDPGDGVVNRAEIGILADGVADIVTVAVRALTDRECDTGDGETELIALFDGHDWARDGQGHIVVLVIPVHVVEEVARSRSRGDGC